MTGESIPVEKKPGDALTGATLVSSGRFVMKALRVGDDTALAQIIKLVDEATSSKAPIARLADRVSGVFVPVVIGIALLTLVVWLFLGRDFSFALTCAISVLVISCPCARRLPSWGALAAALAEAFSLRVLKRLNCSARSTVRSSIKQALSRPESLRSSVLHRLRPDWRRRSS